MAVGAKKGKRMFIRVVFLLGLFLAVFSARGLFLNWRADLEARTEYVELRNLSAMAQAHPDPAPPPDPGADPNSSEPIVTQTHPLVDINPDFVGWIYISGTRVDYPVVRGSDNEAYLYTTFRGESNAAGSIFMDYRALGDFSTPVTILYGHNMRDGSMFSSLLQFLDPTFRNNHPEITIVTAQMETLVYRIIYARHAGAFDSVYSLDFNDSEAAALHFGISPTEARHFLVLSTCGDGRDRNARVVVYAMLIEEGSGITEQNQT